MPDEQTCKLEDRILVLAPTIRDAAMSCKLLTAAGLACHLCNTIQEVCGEMPRGAAAGVVTAEALLADRSDCMVEALRVQPPWSDFPLVVLTAPGSDLPKNLAMLEAIGHMTFMKRPVQVAALVSIMRAAVRDRRRQYVVRDYLLEQRRQADRKDEFLAMLAHELRNPLAPIRNSLQVMRLAGDKRAMFDESRAMMERQVGHMVRIIDDLLDVSRVSRGQVDLRRGRVDLATVIQAAIETSRPTLDAPGQLTVSLPEAALWVDADATRLAQVFANLLNNAAKYTEPGGQISLTARREGDQAVVRVRDTGIGIPVDMLPKVFDLFTQVDRTLDRAQGGLGIGLTLAKTLVELHGGTIEAASEGRGRGSEFTVRLPALPAGTADGISPRAAGTNRPASPKAVRILIVDDNEDAATSLAALLRMFGHDVETVYDGPAALRTVETHRPAVVFLDLGMPGMNGFEVARKLRQRRELAPVRLVALSGWGADVDRRRSRESGFDQHFVKPVEPTELLNYLDQIGVTVGTG